MLEAALRSAGWDVLNVIAAGWSQESDDRILQHAADTRRVLVTANRQDFLNLDRAWRSAGRQHCGIIIRYPQNSAWRLQVQSIERVLEPFEQSVDGLVLWARAR